VTSNVTASDTLKAPAPELVQTPALGVLPAENGNTEGRDDSSSHDIVIPPVESPVTESLDKPTQTSENPTPQQNETLDQKPQAEKSVPNQGPQINAHQPHEEPTSP